MILFSAISKGTLILCEHTESNEDFQQLISKQLKFIKNKQEKQQFQINEYISYLLQNNQFNFLCLMQQQLKNEEQQEHAYNFLKDISDKFQLMTQTQGIDKGQFTKTMAELMSQYNTKSENSCNDLKHQIYELIEECNFRIESKQEINTPGVFENIQDLPKKDNLEYSVFTCKSVFFVINLFLAGVLVELFAKFNRYL